MTEILPCPACGALPHNECQRNTCLYPRRPEYLGNQQEDADCDGPYEDPADPQFPSDLGHVQTICEETAYGLTTRLSFQIKVF
jgi:hypothetical protein